MITLVDKHKAATAIAIAPRTLKDYRQKYFTEGLHYHWYNSRTVRYDIEAVSHWATHQDDPVAHCRWLETRNKAGYIEKS